MRTRQNRIGFLSSIAMAMAATVAATNAAHATVLTYDIRWSNDLAYWGSGWDLPGTFPTYGHNVTSTNMFVGQISGSDTWYHYGQGNGFTPNVTVTHAIGPGGNTLVTYEDAAWQRVFYPTATNQDAITYVTFTPQAGYAVQVNSFTVESWDSGGPATGTTHTMQWTLYKDVIGGTVLASSTPTGNGTPGGSPATFSFNEINPERLITTNAGAYLGTVVLELHHLTGTIGFYAFDNTNFDQFLPEPASAVLFALALGTMVRRRRRQATST